jgi:hypothetical protein
MFPGPFCSRIVTALAVRETVSFWKILINRYIEPPSGQKLYIFKACVFLSMDIAQSSLILTESNLIKYYFIS